MASLFDFQSRSACSGVSVQIGMSAWVCYWDLGMAGVGDLRNLIALIFDIKTKQYVI